MSFALRMLVAVAFAAVVVVTLSGQPVGRVPAAHLDLADVGATAPSSTVPPSTTITTTAASVSAAAAAAAAPAAPAPTTTAPARTAAVESVGVAAVTSDPIDQQGAAALALVPFPIERTGYELIFEGHRDGYLGLTSTVNKTITIYIRSSQSTREIAKVIAHEVGHAVDVEFTTETERLLYRQVRGIDGRSWYPDCSGCTDYDSPAGDFAETFAAAMVGDVSFLSTVAGPPTSVQLQALRSIFTI